MRAITLTQPWCGLMAAGIKRIENRTRPLIKREMIGEDIAFHASREIDNAVYERIAEIAPDVLRFEERNGATIPVIPCQRDWYRHSRVTSAITHVATLVDVLEVQRKLDPTDDNRWREFEQAVARGTVTADQWRWYFAQVGYVFNDERILPEPVACAGKLGFWILPEDVEAKVREQMARAA